MCIERNRSAHTHNPFAYAYASELMLPILCQILCVCVCVYFLLYQFIAIDYYTFYLCGRVTRTTEKPTKSRQNPLSPPPPIFLLPLLHYILFTCYFCTAKMPGASALAINLISF